MIQLLVLQKRSYLIFELEIRLEIQISSEIFLIRVRVLEFNEAQNLLIIVMISQLRRNHNSKLKMEQFIQWIFGQKWSPDCEEPMEENHAEWRGKVKIVGMSVDEDTKLVVERVKVHKRSKLILSYNVDIKEEAKINSFLENNWNQIPENLRQVKKFKIRDPQTYFKEIKAKKYLLHTVLKFHTIKLHEHQSDLIQKKIHILTYKKKQRSIQSNLKTNMIQKLLLKEYLTKQSFDYVETRKLIQSIENYKKMGRKRISYN